VLYFGTAWDMVIERYLSTGAFDTTFNGTGYIKIHNAAGGNSDDQVLA
jgi:hypothetical protein